MRGFFGIIALSMFPVGSAWILPRVEGPRLDNEVKRRVILKAGVADGVDQVRRSA